MHAQRTRMVVALGWFLFWLLMVSVAVQDYLRDQGTALWQPVLWETSSIVVAFCLLQVQTRFSAHKDHLLATPWRWFAVQAMWLPLHWLAFVPLAFGIRHAVYALASLSYEHEPWPEIFLYESLKISVFIGMFILIRFGVLSYSALLEEKLRAEKSHALLREAQLQRLTGQMQPHFLFNALNTISSLMHTDVEKADATLIRLADVLRSTLDLGEQHEVPLARELALVRGYAAVMQARYADRVEIAWQIDDAALHCQVPVLSVQPLLENIFKHTVEQQRQLTHITVSARCEEGMLTVLLEDDRGTLRHGPHPGIGLHNLRERLAVLHGGRASMLLTQRDPAGVRAEMRLPCGS